MRWSFEELFKAWSMYHEPNMWEAFKRFPRNTYYRFKLFFHWLFKGYAKQMLWSLDQTLIETFIQRLKQFQKHNNNSYPANLEGIQEWRDIIDRLITGLKVMKDETILDEILEDKSNLKEMYDKQEAYDKKTMELFVKHFRDLWD